jgi:hypothetical protein
MLALMRFTPKLAHVFILMVAFGAIPEVPIAEATTQTVTVRSAVTTLDDGSAAEQAFIFSGLTKGRDLGHWQMGNALRATLEAATGPGGHRLRVSLAQPPSPEHGLPGVIYIGQSTHKQLDLATYTSSHDELQIIVTHTPVLS